MYQPREVAMDPGPAGPQAGELPGLELHMPFFVQQNALAQPSQHGGGRGALQGGVVHLREDLRGDKYGDGDLEAPEEVAQSAEDAVGKGVPDERDTIQLQEPGEVPSMAVLFGDEESQRQEIVVIAGFRRVPFRVVIEVFPL